VLGGRPTLKRVMVLIAALGLALAYFVPDPERCCRRCPKGCQGECRDRFASRGKPKCVAAPCRCKSFRGTVTRLINDHVPADEAVGFLVEHTKFELRNVVIWDRGTNRTWRHLTDAAGNELKPNLVKVGAVADVIYADDAIETVVVHQ